MCLSLDRLPGPGARGRDRDDAVQRRCARHRPARGGALSAGCAREPLAKPPGVAETVEWAEAATILNEQGVPWPRAFARAIGVVLKDQDDLAYVAPRIDALIMGSAA